MTRPSARRAIAPRVHRADHRPEPVLVEPAQVEQVVDQPDRLLGRVEHLEGGARHRRRVLLPHQHLRPAEHRGQRVPELVVHHGEEPLPGAVELLHLLQQPGALLVQPGVLHRGGRMRREQHRDVLVLVGEASPPSFSVR